MIVESNCFTLLSENPAMNATEPGAKLSAKYKLTARTTPGMVLRFKEFVDKIGFTHGRQFRGNEREVRASQEHTIILVLLHFLDLPFAEQLAIYDKYRPIYEKMLDEWQEGPAPDPAPIEPAAVRRSSEPRPGKGKGR